MLTANLATHAQQPEGLQLLQMMLSQRGGTNVEDQPRIDVGAKGRLLLEKRQTIEREGAC